MAGLSYKHSERLEWTVSGWYSPKRSQTNKPTGDLFSVLGAGSVSTTSQYEVEVGPKFNCDKAAAFVENINI